MYGAVEPSAAPPGSDSTPYVAVVRNIRELAPAVLVAQLPIAAVQVMVWLAARMLSALPVPKVGRARFAPSTVTCPPLFHPALASVVAERL